MPFSAFLARILRFRLESTRFKIASIFCGNFYLPLTEYGYKTNWISSRLRSCVRPVPLHHFVKVWTQHSISLSLINMVPVVNAFGNKTDACADCTPLRHIQDGDPCLFNYGVRTRWIIVQRRFQFWKPAGKVGIKEKLQLLPHKHCAGNKTREGFPVSPFLPNLPSLAGGWPALLTWSAQRQPTGAAAFV